jgi:hypothetical protein
MCFSATASFTTSAVLLSLGVVTLRQAANSGHGYLALAAFPLLFGIQQGFEGLLWLNQDGAPLLGSRLPILIFLWFVYGVWPLLVPLTAWQLETRPLRRRLFAASAVLGAAFGAAIFVPLLFEPGWSSARVTNGSISYELSTIFDGHINVNLLRLLYASLVMAPLLASSVTALRRFGVLVLASFLVSALLYRYAFISVWCFFAALLSLYIVMLLQPASEAAPSLRQ